MPLTPCLECGRQISTAAEACPQCGHPNRRLSTSAGPKCYLCSASATTRCHKCGAFSCATHLQSIYVSHGKGGANELRCESCYASAKTSQTIGYVISAIFLVVVFAALVLA